MKKKTNYDFDLRTKYRDKRLSLCLWKTLQQNTSITAYKHVQYLSKRWSIFDVTHPKNFCVLTGRSKGVFRLGHLARNQAKEFINSGNFFSFRKVSW